MIINVNNNNQGLICMMPMRNNVKHAPKSWELVNCPHCGHKCYYRPDMEYLKKMGAQMLCTECALRISRKTKSR